MHREGGTLKQQRQFCCGDLGGASLLCERRHVAQTTALKAPADEVEADAIANDVAQLGAVAFEEQHAVSISGDRLPRPQYS
jgi:hypothetical protein